MFLCQIRVRMDVFRNKTNSVFMRKPLSRKGISNYPELSHSFQNLPT